MNKYEKWSDKHGHYLKCTITITLVFIVVLVISRFTIPHSHNSIHYLNNWFTSLNPSIYENGLLFKDRGTILKLQTTFSLSDIVHMAEPHLVIMEGIIPARVLLNGNDISITHIFPSGNSDTYLIAYKLPLSSLKYINQISILYTSKDIAGWRVKSFIVSSNILDNLFTHYRLTFAINRYVIPIISILGTIIFLILYFYTQEYSMLVFAEANMLFLLTSILIRTTYNSYTLYHSLEIAIGLLILQQISIREKHFIVFITEWILIIPLIYGIFSSQQWSDSIKLISAIGILIISIYHLIHSQEEEEIPIIYWLINFMTFILIESLFNLIAPLGIYTFRSATASVISAISATFLLGSMTLYYHPIEITAHPVNTILISIRNKVPFSSVFIKSHILATNHRLIQRLIVPELCHKDAYTITKKGIWIIKVDTTHEEIVHWTGKMQTKLRVENGIRDTRIGVLEIEYATRDITPWKILKETERLTDMAKYPDFLHIKKQQ